MAKLEIDTDDLTEDAVKALTEALEPAGFHVLSEKAFKGVQSKGAAKVKAEARTELQALQEEHEALKTEHSEAAQKLKELERESMSAAERAEAEAKDRLAELETLRKEAADAKAAREKTAAELRQQRLDATLRDVLKNAHPDLARAARLDVLADFPGMTVDDSKNLVLKTADGVELVGDEAMAHLGEHWAGKTQFHAPQTPGPSTAGSAKPAPKSNGEFTPLSPFEGSAQERYNAARAAMAARKQ
jgi:hypothetical protein